MANNLKDKVKDKAEEVNNPAPQPEMQPEKKPVSVGVAFKNLLDSPSTKARFEQTLKEKSAHFVTSMISLFNSDALLQKCDQVQILNCAFKAAALDLPVDKNLGYVWIIAYKDWKASQKLGRDIYIPEVQLGYKGYIQLALRTGQYTGLNAIPIYEGELESFDRLTEKLVLDFSKKKSDAIIGFAGYFELINGFKKTVYWTVDEVRAHKERFSKQKGESGTWTTDFEAMGIKTVLKNMLGKWGILSIEMQQAYSDEVNIEKAEVTSPDAMLDGNPIPAYTDADYVEVKDQE